MDTSKWYVGRDVIVVKERGIERLKILRIGRKYVFVGSEVGGRERHRFDVTQEPPQHVVDSGFNADLVTEEEYELFLKRISLLGKVREFNEKHSWYRRVSLTPENIARLEKAVELLEKVETTS